MRALISIFIVLTMFAGFLPAYAQAEPQVNAYSAIVIDPRTGEEIYKKNASTIMYPASTTKIMTALLAVEYGNLDAMVTVGDEVNMIAWDSSRAYLQPGDTISLRDLVYGMMLASGNDAAYAVAVHIARLYTGDANLSAISALDVFAELMNQRAMEIGANDTNFVNPDGYPHERHYTTAKDLALIMGEAMKDPAFRKFDSASQHMPSTWTGNSVRSWKNGNYLIQPESGFYYSKAMGGKTGYTVPAGFTMVATAAQADLELVAVVLNTDADGRWLDTVSLLEYGFVELSREAELNTVETEEGTEEKQEKREQGKEDHGEDSTSENIVLTWLRQLLNWLMGA